MRREVMSLLVLLLIGGAHEDSAAMAIAQAGCAAMAVACYAAGGAVFETITAGLGMTPAIVACNAAFGTCMSAASVAFLLPTP